MDIELSIIVPCYNESEVVEKFFSAMVGNNGILNNLGLNCELVFINDGSKDNTLELLKAQKEIYSNKSNLDIKIVNLSRNFGKEAAMSAGFSVASGEAIVPMDADLQHPASLIPKFVELWRQGYDVVLAKRANRQDESALKRFCSSIFYKLNNKISEIEIPQNVGDFRLFTKKVLNAINSLPENQRFMKGIFAWVGFRSITIEYEEQERIAGSSKFNGWKLWNFALQGITGFGTLPLRIWTYIGFIVSFFAFIYASFLILRTLIMGIDLPGYASLVVIILFLGGLQLMGVGILGEYVGRIYMESKRRPPFIIDEIY
ncbi:MAG: glycosyltransferase family 2 protein [Campylobacter sp.]|uniref:glycosyltransferase family 2 protein n=1 Tax=Campylobacter sp. TaxID=205 RepID=UPI002A80F25B|nr:glycosyltransferase family 2 protein [Campylobacter sp.]MCI7023995.1 glycosyltransferase family 2 protein [Campylobacter sp.]MDY4154118.1 glycosyltransferase family 2 protein [Campylobacter sp.]